MSLAGVKPKATSETRLAFGAADYLAITPGRMSGYRALYVDYSAGNGVYSTDVIYFTGGGLKSYFGSYSELPVRYEEIISEDIDDDGTPEIPVQHPATDAADESAAYITEYIKLTAHGEETVMTAVINLRDGYLFELTGGWIDGVELRRAGEGGEWRFFEKTADGRTGSELLRIKTVNKNTYHDKFDESYKLVVEKGVNQYYMFLPVSNSPLGLSLTECIKRFRLLSGS